MSTVIEQENLDLNHYVFMQQALREAEKAGRKDEVPIGAIVVHESGVIIARAYNLVEMRHTQAAHAEVLVLAKAGKKVGDWRLQECWLYVTLEPCAMCFNLIKLSRLKGVVYGAASPLFGYHLDNVSSLWLYKDRPFPFKIVEGVGARQAADLLKKFFKNKRIVHE
jgi:tRNA(adenine34) deaminase